MSVAKAYARALFETATGAKSSSQEIQTIEDELGALLGAIEKSKEAKIALFSPLVNAKDKGVLVESITKKANMTPIVARFLALLARKGRLSLLSKIQKAFALVRVEAEGGMIGTVVAADPVGTQDVEALAKAFGRKLNKRVAFHVSTDPSLLAGMKVTVNGVTYDGTLRSQLQKLRDQIKVALPGS
jgi:F-type H+-transporting ATPase subunit delta